MWSILSRVAGEFVWHSPVAEERRELVLDLVDANQRATNRRRGELCYVLFV